MEACKCQSNFGERVKLCVRCGPHRWRGWIKRAYYRPRMKPETAKAQRREEQITFFCFATSRLRGLCELSTKRIGVIERAEAAVARREFADGGVQIWFTVVGPEHVADEQLGVAD